MKPDLQPLQSYLSGWTLGNTGGNNREIRLSAGTGNGGIGALHFYSSTIHPPNAQGVQTRDVMQRIFNNDATFIDRLVGGFVYHPTHGHFHIEHWSAYRLRLRNPDVGPVVAETRCTTFCILDLDHYNPGLPGSPANSQYSTCNSATQGLSVGWSDVLGSGLPGQSINVSGALNGSYWLEHDADPNDTIDESNETNNVARIPITLTGMPAALLRVTLSTPNGTVNQPISAVDFAFNQPLNTATFTLADVSFTGPSGAIGVTSISQVNEITHRLSFPVQSMTGAYSLNIGPNISSAGGALLDQNFNGVGGEVGDFYPAFFFVEVACPADVNDSGTVNIDDLVALITSWGNTGSPSDINRDGTVNIDDLVILITSWGPCA